MPRSGKERQADLAARHRAAGRVQRKVWAHPEDWARITKYVMRMNRARDKLVIRDKNPGTARQSTAPKWRRTAEETMKTLTFAAIAAAAGFAPEADGKLNIPATQATADALAKAASDIVGEWMPGDERTSVILTGAGPVWGYLAIAHALHGRVTALHYAAPNAEIKVFGHGE